MTAHQVIQPEDHLDLVLADQLAVQAERRYGLPGRLGPAVRRRRAEGRLLEAAEAFQGARAAAVGAEEGPGTARSILTILAARVAQAFEEARVAAQQAAKRRPPPQNWRDRLRPLPRPAHLRGAALIELEGGSGFMQLRERTTPRLPRATWTLAELVVGQSEHDWSARPGRTRFGYGELRDQLKGQRLRFHDDAIKTAMTNLQWSLKQLLGGSGSSYVKNHRKRREVELTPAWVAIMHEAGPWLLG